MSLIALLFNPFFLLLLLFVIVPLLRYFIYRRREDAYFRRMYRTMRQAQEDANKEKDKRD